MFFCWVFFLYPPWSRSPNLLYNYGLHFFCFYWQKGNQQWDVEAPQNLTGHRFQTSSGQGYTCTLKFNSIVWKLTIYYFLFSCQDIWRISADHKQRPARDFQCIPWQIWARPAEALQVQERSLWSKNGGVPWWTWWSGQWNALFTGSFRRDIYFLIGNDNITVIY